MKPLSRKNRKKRKRKRIWGAIAKYKQKRWALRWIIIFASDPMYKYIIIVKETKRRNRFNCFNDHTKENHKQNIYSGLLLSVTLEPCEIVVCFEGRIFVISINRLFRSSVISPISPTPAEKSRFHCRKIGVSLYYIYS